MIKHTPPEHADYLCLQTALTKLENIANQVNELKRKHEIDEVSKQLQDENKIKHKESRTLIRQDDVVEVVILIINTGPGYMCKFT